MPVKNLGAPAQHSQPSRKGKKSWRKNIDIDEIEEGLESLRDEERIIGAKLHQQTDTQLFLVDLTGDEKLKKSLPKYDRSQLTSTKILAQRSAMPPVPSRASSSKRARSKLTHEEKGRLLRIGKRTVKGPFNAVVDPAGLGSGTAMLEPTEAVKKSGSYDIWSHTHNQSQAVLDFAKDKGKYKDPEEFLLPLVVKPKVKAPETSHPRRSIDLPAIVQPHQGTSYNPPVTAHQELLLAAHEVELRRELADAKLADFKKQIESARLTVFEAADTGAPGMLIDSGDIAVGYENDVGASPMSAVPAPKAPARKTGKQRRKAAQVLAEKRSLLDRRRQRRLMAAIYSAKSLRVQVASSLRAREAAQLARRAARAESLQRHGLVGKRLGKHRVSEGQVDVQLGEELSESLRGIRPQGNLFRDRFLSLQHRALIEPRVPVIPKRRKTKIKEYEKHAWKRFE